MTAVHDVLRYLLERVPHNSQDEKDRVAALIDQDAAADAVDATTEPTDEKKD